MAISLEVDPAEVVGAGFERSLEVDPAEVVGAGFERSLEVDPAEVVGAGFKRSLEVDPAEVVGAGFERSCGVCLDCDGAGCVWTAMGWVCLDCDGAGCVWTAMGLGVFGLRWVSGVAAKEGSQLRAYPCKIPRCPVPDPSTGSQHWIPALDPGTGSRHWIPALDPSTGSRHWIPALDHQALLCSVYGIQCRDPVPGSSAGIRLLQAVGVPRARRYEALRETALRGLDEDLFAKDLVIAQSRRAKP